MQEKQDKIPEEHKEHINKRIGKFNENYAKVLKKYQNLQVNELEKTLSKIGECKEKIIDYTKTIINTYCVDKEEKKSSSQGTHNNKQNKISELEQIIKECNDKLEVKD